MCFSTKDSKPIVFACAFVLGAFLNLEFGSQHVMRGKSGFAQFWGTPPAFGQEAIRTRAGLHPDYGRVVFDWSRQVDYSAMIEGAEAVITFAEPLSTDLSSVSTTIGNYVTASRIENGGRIVRFSLTSPATLTSFRSGNSIAIDFRQAATAEASQSEDVQNPEQRVSEQQNQKQQNPGSLTLEPGRGSSVPVRVGQHPTYTRLVFDFADAPSFSANEEAGVVTIRFRTEAALDAEALAAQLPEPFSAPITGLEGDETVLQFSAPGGSSLRTFLSGQSVVLDVTAGSGPPGIVAAAIAEAAPEAAPEAPPDASLEAPADEPALEPAPEQITDASETVTGGDEALIVPEGEKTLVEGERLANQEDDVASGPVALVPQTEGAEDTEALRPQEGIEPSATSDTEIGALTEEEQIAIAPNEQDVISSQAGTTEDAGFLTGEDAAEQGVDAIDTRARVAQEQTGPITQEEAATAEALQDGRVSFLRDQDGRAVDPDGPPPVSFSFDWPEEVGAAAYKRSGYIWVVFDRRAPIDLAPLRQQGAPLIDRIEQLPVSGATVIRMRAQSEVTPVVSLEGFNWVVDFRLQPRPAKSQAEIQAEADADTGPRLLFPTANPGGLITVPDPDVGDSVQVATYKDPGVGVIGTRTYPEFRILESAQGVVIEPIGDDVVFERSFEGYTISSTEGLHISAISPQSPVSSSEQTFSARRLFNMGEWVRGGLGDFLSTERALMVAVGEVPADKKNDARLDLVRFYVARDRGAEATGVLSVIEGDNEALFKNAENRALRGATHVLNGALEKARQDLSDPRLDAFAEAALWRGVAMARLGDWAQSTEQFKAGDSILRDYPFPLKAKLALLRIESALSTRDIQTARAWLDELERDSELLTRGQLGDLRYHQGRVALTRNDIELARDLWQELIEGNDLKNSARAEYALINMERRQGNIEEEEVIERLERLRFKWRGDRFELAALRRLGEVYFDSGDYFNGFSTWRQAVSYFSEDPLAEELAQDMTELFRRLFLDGEADSLPPLRALALYDEFRELTPSGTEGDRLIEQLADRLVTVDLLGRASDLLDHQVEFRLQGAERARIGAKLAYIRLIDNNPVGAIDGLNKTAFPQLQNELEDDRRRLRAKAMFELDRDDESIKLLAGDTSVQADILRQDIYRRAENWTEAAKVLQRLSGDPPGPNDEIEEGRAWSVVQWAVALKLDRDQTGLDLLRELYGPAMNISSYREMFNYIVQPLDEGGASLQASLEQLGSGPGFGAFLENYRDRLLSPQLSGDSAGPITRGSNNF